MKICSKCKLEKELGAFHNDKNGKLGKHHYCKLCNSEQKKTILYKHSKHQRKKPRKVCKIHI